ncbi:MAG: YajQ family cyclic di-GMP-binding protein [Myxococcales bacterium]|nr:MAG: YajQ family cyclic di-GMP-binding protein [Myxococcales bacterium]
MPSFDVVSELDKHEIDNAIKQASQEVTQRFDFKGTQSEIEKTDDGIVLKSNSEGRVEAVLEVLKSKLVRRKVSLKALDPQKIEPGGKGIYRQLLKLKEGVDQETAKKMVKFIKDSKLKVQASIQGDQLRISGKKRDDLQETIALLKEQDFGLEL